MIAVITSENRQMFGDTVAQMHRDRKTVFVDGLKWNVPVIDGQFEADEYDTEAAVYLIAQDPATDAHLGSLRLVCTAGPHLLGDKFAFLCDGSMPSGLDIWEITRLCTSPMLDTRAALAVRMKLVMGVMEFGLANGVACYTMMTHVAYLPTLLAVGWDIEPLGLPAMVEGDSVGALQITVNIEGLARLRTLYGFERAVLDDARQPSTLAA